MSAAARASGYKPNGMWSRRAVEERSLLLHVISQNARAAFSSPVNMCVLLAVRLRACMHWLLSRNPSVVVGNTWQRGGIIWGTCLGLGWVTEGTLGCLQWSCCIPAPCHLASPWAGLDAVHKSCQGLGEPAGSVTDPRAPKRYARGLLCLNLFITRGMAVGLPVIPASVNLCAVVL